MVKNVKERGTSLEAALLLLTPLQGLCSHSQMEEKKRKGEGEEKVVLFSELERREWGASISKIARAAATATLPHSGQFSPKEEKKERGERNFWNKLHSAF